MECTALYSDPKLNAYCQGRTEIPARYWLWPLYGAGLENLGQDGQPIQVETPQPGPDQLLVRHDAVGLCFSDTKVIKAGDTHPRLNGRDMKANPVVLGHEVALTVVKVGSRLTGQYQVGARFIVQADIYFKGVGMAYGYALQGGLSQYNVVGPEVLNGDEGSYLIPVRRETGYSQAALTEPWACVGRSYDITYRVGWRPEGTVLIVAGPTASGAYTLGTPYAGGQAPKRVITLGVGGALLAELRARCITDRFDLVALGAPSEETLAQAKAATTEGTFDDIVFLGADAALYEWLEPYIDKGGVLNLVGGEDLTEPAPVDVGRLHYDMLSLVGTDGHDISAAYQPIRTELVSDGKAAFIGAAGPMGQMHVQRALQAPDGPRLIVATDLVPERLGVIGTKYGQLIDAKRGKGEVYLLTPDGKSGAEFNASLLATSGGAGYDDVVVLAPSAGVVAGSVSLLAPNGVMNIFAGLPRGSKAKIDLRVVAEKGVRFTGTSGSEIRDLRNMLNAAESGRLDPNLSVAAVSGLRDVTKGLEGVIAQTFPGKVVIYPQILDFPLTPLADLATALPNVYAKLGSHESWTVEAEAEFLKELLP
ncbi:MAG: alcohol dehydrogenase catalytic domain-containing protein [Anaerolineae bacterium]